MTARHVLIAAAGFFIFCTQATAADRVVYEGDSGPGKGKHILFIASDHEYRGEETCPAVARIMAKRYGFKCTVLFGQTPDGLIKPGSSLIPGIEAIDDADMLFLFLRFVHPEDAWMEKLEGYLKRGGPVLGLRTTTHAFNGLTGQVCLPQLQLGAMTILLAASVARSSAKRGTRNSAPGTTVAITSIATAMHVVPATKEPSGDARRQGHARAWLGPTRPGRCQTPPSSPPTAFWSLWKWGRSRSRSKAAAAGRLGTYLFFPRAARKVAHSVQHSRCASEDILSEGVRRMIINATLWCMEMEDQIKADADVSFVGPYNPSTFSFKASVTDATPGDIEGWDTPILKPKKQ